MRQVILDGRWGLCEDAPLRNKLAGHLNARLLEYEEEGLLPALEEPGVVSARFPGRNGEQVICELTRQGVHARTAGDRVQFLIGPKVTFEDLDYVQSVAAGLLGEVL